MSTALQPSRRVLPRDCVLLPLEEGRLLASREHATSCRLPADTPVEPVLEGVAPVESLAEGMVEDRVTALEWPVPPLLAEARARGIDAPDLVQVLISRHLLEI